MDLTEKQQLAITESINDLFYKLAVKLLGRFFKGPKIYFALLKDFNMLDTLEGAYRYSLALSHGPGFEPDEKRIKRLSKITQGYLDSQRLKTLNHVLMAVEAGDDVEEVKEEVQKQLDKATNYVDLLVNNEFRVTQAYAERDGIERLSASLGIDDPTVVKLGQVDNKLCKECRNLWHSSENVKVPKAYKLSELKSGYMDHKNPEPTELPSHPRCRHVLTMVPAGYTFNGNGVIQFKAFNFDFYADQHGAK